MFVVNRTKLVSQTAESLGELGCGDDLGFIQAGRPMDAEAPLVIASIQTLRSRFSFTDADDAEDTQGRGEVEGEEEDVDPVDALAAGLGRLHVHRPRLPEVDVVLLDEAHGAVAPSYLQLCDTYRARGAFLVGLSATPVRLNPQETLARAFDRLLIGPSISSLIQTGVLAQPVIVHCDGGLVRRYLGSRRSAEYQAADLRRYAEDGAWQGR